MAVKAAHAERKVREHSEISRGSGDADDDDLKANEDKENGAEDLIDQLPEYVQPFPRHFGHAKIMAVIADDDARRDHEMGAET